MRCAERTSIQFGGNSCALVEKFVIKEIPYAIHCRHLSNFNALGSTETDLVKTLAPWGFQLACVDAFRQSEAFSRCRNGRNDILECTAAGSRDSGSPEGFEWGIQGLELREGSRAVTLKDGVLRK